MSTVVSTRTVDARARRLEYATLASCFTEAAVGVGAGVAAGSGEACECRPG